MKRYVPLLALAFVLTACAGMQTTSTATQPAEPTKNTDSSMPVAVVYFDFDKSDLKTTEQDKIDDFVEGLTAAERSGKVHIEGHADEKGTDAYNMALGKRRATAVRAFLMEKGFKASQISTVSYGEERPAVEGDSEDEMAKNRRAEVFLMAAPSPAVTAK